MWDRPNYTTKRHPPSVSLPAGTESAVGQARLSARVALLRVVALITIISADTRHFCRLWSDGLISVGCRGARAAG